METNFPHLEEQTLKRWRQIRAFEKSLERRKRSPRFVFYEGPPTANAGPGIHHVLSRVYKDVVLRYKTMRGYFVPRRAGWDTHGLPVELQIEKKLGLSSKKDIEEYGIAKFNEECRKSVWEFQQDWERLTERIGFWLDMENPYITYRTAYMETLWQIISKWFTQGLLYRDYKVVPYCARCGTPLSSHELAQGYKTVTDPAVYVKFKAKGERNTFFLAWTTTPWTLPGNVALAVHPTLSYVVARKGEERYIVAEERAEAVLGAYELVKSLKGKELLGMEYEPVFRFAKPQQGKKAWEVVPADFVSAEEGTGLVHTAVAYGADDFELGKKENLAMFHLVTEEGTFAEQAAPFKGMFVKDADPLIIQELARKGALLKKENYEHDYPHCWRCSTPLLYYAKETWFVAASKLKDRLIANNQKVNWVPPSIKNGRFGEWLREVKDWAFSRERYWGTPLPLWQCRACGEFHAIGSLAELAKQKFSDNAYSVMRHGESEKNVANISVSWPEKKPVPLTAKGRKQAEKAARELKKVDVIYSSDLVRAKETAEIVAKATGAKLVFDKRLRELSVGTFNYKPIEEMGSYFAEPGETKLEHYLKRFEKRLPKGENWKDVQGRVLDFMKDLEERHEGEKILVVGHELPLLLLETLMQGLSRTETVEFRLKKKMRTGEVRKVAFRRFPYNRDMEVDLHRPYVDEITFRCPSCKEGKTERVRDVVDVWYDSGSMPFAQAHWPFERQQSAAKPPAQFPADYIVEAVDQTRGWFYTLLAVSTLLKFGPPYRNVVSLGHVLDENGEKMSKSKGNIVNPWTMIDKYGVDTLRWYFYTVNHPGDSKLFAEKELVQAQRRFLMTLWNSLAFLETYRKAGKAGGASRNVLDRWIVSKTQGVVGKVTEAMEEYNITEAARRLEEFVVEDVSQWYIRRSRRRFQSPNTRRELAEASATLQEVLGIVSRLAAPFTPFLAEEVYGRARAGAHKSVHWEDWPKPDKKRIDGALEREMEDARGVVAEALALRSAALVKVRQPLASLTVPRKLSRELLELIGEEVNVKEVLVGKKLALDTNMTPELEQEGMLRELLRNVQDMRKRAGYKPQDRIRLRYSAGEILSHLLHHRAAHLKAGAGAAFLEEGPKRKEAFDEETEFEVGGHRIWVGVRKV